MAGDYVINTTNASMKQWVQFSYEHTLNGMSNGQIALDGVTGGYKAEFDVDTEVNIYRRGTLKFRGIVFDKEDMISGGVILSLLGIEHELMEAKSPMVGSLLTRAWASTSDHTILNTLVTSVAGWTIDTSNSTDTNVDFRTAASESVWNAVIRLVSDGGKDIKIDQANKKVYLYDELTRADKFSFIEGKNASGIGRRQSRTMAAKVIVYGKGDGENQIVGSNGSGNPVHVIIDRNIVTTTQANARALVEYNKVNPKQKSYTLNPTSSIDTKDLQVGDMGNIASNSANINEEVDIVRIKTLVDGTGNEKLSMAVTNPAYRLASKNVAEERSRQEASYDQSQSSMQGSGNTLTWARGINAKNGSPLNLPFYLPSDFITDEAGNLRVNSMTLDYDVDPYRRGVASASESNHAPDLSTGNTDNHKHNPADSGHPHANAEQTSSAYALVSDQGSDTFSGTTLNVGWNNDALTEAVSGTFDFLYVRVILIANFSGAPTIGIGIHLDAAYHANRVVKADSANITTYLVREIFIIPVFASTSATIKVDIYTDISNSYDGYLFVYGGGQSHTHAITTWNTENANAAVDDNNRNPALAGNSENHNHSVSVGDDVSDAASINASEVDIHLDHWENKAITNNETAGANVVIEMSDTGTIAVDDVVYFDGTNKEWATVSAVVADTSITATIATNKSAGDKITWVKKHSITSTGKTLDEDVDITDSGTYPDVAGWWRVRVNPDNASADYVQSIIKVKHALDA